jgi:hypothetical protein
MAPSIIAAVMKNSRERIALRLTKHHGHNLIDLRVFDHAGNVEFPTKSGFALQVEHLPALRQALDEAIVEAFRQGLLTRELVPDGIVLPKNRRQI